MSVTIKTVEPDSLGAFLELAPGDRLLKINGKKVLDHLDYRFRIIDEAPVLEFERGKKIDIVEVDKDEETDLGVTFEEMPIRKCANDCVFCFVDQNPSGMRETLYFRDGDYRLSFLFGHYITLTNMGPVEMQRVVDQGMSPLYISVHATDPELRKKILLYRKDDNLMDKMHFLVDNGIELHSQIVLCPGLNDGDALKQTLDDLAPLMPGLKSVAIVPVGLTGHRKGLIEIPPVTKEYAEQFLREYEVMDKAYRQPDGGRFILPSDEWFITTGRDMPSSEFYAGLEMEENGVGQVRQFLDTIEKESADLPQSLSAHKSITIATGKLAGPIFAKHIVPRLEEIDGLTVNLQIVKNRLLGDPVSVTGLLSGKDFIDHLGGQDLGDSVWTTDRILNENFVTLDDMTLDQISDKLSVPFNIVGDSLLALIEGVIRG